MTARPSSLARCLAWGLGVDICKHVAKNAYFDSLKEAVLELKEVSSEGWINDGGKGIDASVSLE